METDIVLRDICPALPGAVRRAVESMHPALRRGLNEVRLRKGRQVCVVIKASTTAFLPTARRPPATSLPRPWWWARQRCRKR